MSARYECVLCLIAVIAASVDATSLGDFFQVLISKLSVQRAQERRELCCVRPKLPVKRIHDEGSLTTYQCYRNGTTLEPESSRKFAVIWNSSGQPINKAQCDCTFQLDGDSEEHRFEATARYETQGDYGILSGDGRMAYLYQLQPPFQGEAYYFKEVDPSNGNTGFKIYDTEETCTNAEALRSVVCSEPCDLEYLR